MIELPEMEKGDFRIEKFVVSKEQAEFHNLREMIKGSRHITGGRFVTPGTYTRLVRKSNKTVVMSNTPAEMLDHSVFISNAKGHVLINGLGIGYVADACCEKPDVEHVTVVELEQDVIDMVAPILKKKHGNKITIVCHDAHTYTPPRGVRYNCVWHDIWDYIDSDNLPSMNTLHRKYGRRCDYQDSWSRKMALRMRRCLQ